MPRIRSIKPDLWKSEKIASRLPGAYGRELRLLWIGMWNFAEDSAVIRANPRYILSEVFPYEEDISVDEMARRLADLESVRLLFRYERDGLSYYWIRGFSDHQRIDRPSKPTLPAPTPEEIAGWEESAKTPGGLDERSTRARGGLDEDSTKTPVRIGEDRKGEEGRGGDLRTAPAEKPRAPVLPFPSPTPEKPKATTKPPSRLKAVESRLVAAFAEVMGSRYGHRGAPDAEGLKRILGWTDDDAEIERRWRRSLAAQGFDHCASIAELSAKWNRFAGAGPPDLRRPIDVTRGTVRAETQDHGTHTGEVIPDAL